MDSFRRREILDFSLISNIKPMPIGSSNSGDQADALPVRKMVEDHWRAFLLEGRQDPAGGVWLIESFEQRIQAQAESMPANKGAAFKAAVERERERLFSEYENNPKMLMQRLNIGQVFGSDHPPTRHGNRQGFGELVVRTAVRATVWEIVRSLFRR